MANLSIVICVAALLIQGSILAAGQTATHVSETSLRAALASGYDQKTRPYTPTYVDLNYYLRSLHKLSIAEQSFSHTALISVMWHDPRLVWTPSSYANITELDINWTWRPMFSIGNSADSTEMIGSDNDVARVTVFNNGSVIWLRTIIPTTTCDVDVTNFPYDNQECDVYMVFYGNDYGTNLLFNLSSTEVSSQVYVENDEWDLSGSSVYVVQFETCCPVTTSAFITVTVKFDRLHTFYLNTFLIPTILLSICLVWPFYLPSESGERLGFSLTILLSYTVVLTLAADFLPTTSKQVPKLASYLVVVLMLCSIALCNVTINVKLYTLASDPPEFMKTFYRKVTPIVFLEWCCCERKKKSKVSSEVVMVDIVDKPPLDQPIKDDKTSSESEEEVTWALISELFDRICFYVYLFTVTLVNIVLFAYLSGS